MSLSRATRSAVFHSIVLSLVFLCQACTSASRCCCCCMPQQQAGAVGPAAAASHDRGPTVYGGERAPGTPYGETTEIVRPGHPAGARDTFKHHPDRPLAPDEIEKDEKEELSPPAAAPPHADASPLFLQTSGAHKQITLTNQFIERYKNRAVITANCEILGDAVHDAAEDGDVHLPVIVEDLGLNCVAEIMNIKDEHAALQEARNAESSHEPINIVGAWRLWCEHPGKTPHIQFDQAPHGGKPTNPDHVCEIHPVSQIGNTKVLNSFKPIQGYIKVKEAKKAFDGYENLSCQIVPDFQNQTTTILTPEVGLNYVEFWLTIEDTTQFETIGGRMVRCSVQDKDGATVIGNRRMVFVKGTPPELAVKALHQGDKMHVLGIPRIDLAIVSWRTHNATTNPDAFTWNLPYEIIIAGKYDN